MTRWFFFPFAVLSSLVLLFSLLTSCAEYGGAPAGGSSHVAEDMKM